VQELEELHSVSLLRIARVCEGAMDWELLTEVAGLLLKRGTHDDEAKYYLGRVHFAEGSLETAIELLRSAQPGLAPRAPYFLGKALTDAERFDEAIHAFRQVPPGGVFRGLALAEIAVLLRRDMPAQEAAILAILDELKAEIHAMHRVDNVEGETTEYEGGLLAFHVPDTSQTFGARFPFLSLWGNQIADLERLSGVRIEDSGNDPRVHLEDTGLVLQWRWVENLVNWEGVERAYPTDDEIPGWIDTARDWFDLGERASARAVNDGGGFSWLQLEGLAWIFSAPAVIDADKSCLLLGHIRDSKGSGRIGWQYLKGENQVIRHGALADSELLEEWVVRAVYLPPEENREAIRVTLETWSANSDAEFGGVMLLELDGPG
jgi:hypothetical protein